MYDIYFSDIRQLQIRKEIYCKKKQYTNGNV